MSKKKRLTDILDLLNEEGIKAVDKHAYDFLAGQGYNVEGCDKIPLRRHELKQEMRKRKQSMTYSGAIDSEKRAMLIWFELHDTNGKMVARSRGLKFMEAEEEDLPNGRGENSEGQA